MKPSKLLILAPVFLSGCAIVAEYPITAASVAIWGATGKGPVDHAMSNMVQSDCNSARLLDLQVPCKDVVYTLPPVEDRAVYPEKKVAKM